jgi:hypothetical protein
VGCCSTRAQVVFPVDFDGSQHVYRDHPINVQLVTDPVLMPTMSLLQEVVTHVTELRKPL